MSTTTLEAQTALDSVLHNSTTGLLVTDYNNRQTVGDITVDNPKMTCRSVNVYYGEKHALRQTSGLTLASTKWWPLSARPAAANLPFCAA
jgi:hypothetical protein